MAKTQKRPSSEPSPAVPVAGLRIAGRDRVYIFDEISSSDGLVTIGRTSVRSIRIRNDDTISKLHCVIYKNDAGRYEILDSRSTNGTRISDTAPYKNYVNVAWCELEVGHRIKVGGTRLIVVGPDGEPIVAASRLRAIGRVALSLFGSVRAAARRLGLGDGIFKRIVDNAKKTPDNDEEDE